MKAALEAFIAAGHELESVWDADTVLEYPSELPSFDELVILFDGIKLGCPEERLKARLVVAGLWDDLTDYEDLHTGVLFVGNQRMWLGVDHGLNGFWQAVLYVAPVNDEEEPVAYPLSIGELTEPNPDQVLELLLPVLRALKAGLWDCPAVAHHGPGHMSSTHCDRRDVHELDDLHRVTQVRWSWTGEHGTTDEFDRLEVDD